LFEIIVIHFTTAFEELLKVLCSHAITLMYRFQNAMPAGDLPMNALAQFMTHGLSGIQIKRVKSQQGGLDAGDMERVNAMAQSEPRREAIVQTFLGLNGGFAVKRQMNAARKGLEEALLINHTRLEDGWDQGLAAFHRIIEGDSKTRCIGAACLGGGLSEKIDQTGRGHGLGAVAVLGKNKRSGSERRGIAKVVPELRKSETY
jgi:hypothetical protein